MKVTKINLKGLKRSLSIPCVLFLEDQYNLRSLKYKNIFRKFASKIPYDAPFTCLSIDAIKYKHVLNHIGYIVGDVPPILICNDPINGGVIPLRHYLSERDLFRCCANFFIRKDGRTPDVSRGSAHVDVLANQCTEVSDGKDNISSDAVS